MDPTTLAAIRDAIASDASPEDKLAAVNAALAAAVATAKIEAPGTARAVDESTSASSAAPAAAAPAVPLPPIPPRLTVEQALDLVIAKLRAAMPDESKPAPSTTATSPAPPVRIMMVPAPRRAQTSPGSLPTQAPPRGLPTLPRKTTTPATPKRQPPQRRSKP
jgi:hypothetical protein